MLSIVIPVLNEARSLEPLYEEIEEVAAANRLEIEVIFIDDGSTDGSWEAISRIAAGDPRVRGLRFRRNFGKAAALTAGFDEALPRGVGAEGGDEGKQHRGRDARPDIGHEHLHDRLPLRGDDLELGQDREGIRIPFNENLSGLDTGFYGVQNCLWFLGCTGFKTGIEAEKINEWLVWGRTENLKLLEHRRQACGDDGGSNGDAVTANAGMVPGSSNHISGKHPYGRTGCSRDGAAAFGAGTRGSWRAATIAC